MAKEEERDDRIVVVVEVVLAFDVVNFNSLDLPLTPARDTERILEQDRCCKDQNPV